MRCGDPDFPAAIRRDTYPPKRLSLSFNCVVLVGQAFSLPLEFLHFYEIPQQFCHTCFCRVAQALSPGALACVPIFQCLNTNEDCRTCIQQIAIYSSRGVFGDRFPTAGKLPAPQSTKM
jgi:hypothetical protein